jgi:catechol 2,3-dioxygenase-like lactoylglutathione lyase family enzyme
MRESRILAVAHVELQTHAGREEALRWFYNELIGLEVVDEPSHTPPRLRFRSAELELRYSFVPAPNIDEIAHRVTLLVGSLRAARKALEQARMAYTPITGTAFTDRFLSLVDPGGNRVAVRQTWRLVS